MLVCLGAYVWYRQGNAGTKYKGQILCLSFGRPPQQYYMRDPATKYLRPILGNRGHAAISSSEEDLAREGSEEDNGSGRFSQR